MKRPMSLLVAAGIATAAFSPVHAEETMTVSVQRLSLDTARQIAEGAVRACREKGIQVAVTVVDRNGIPQATLRDTLAPPMTLEVSRAKAYTAAMFNAPTSQLVEQASTPIGRVPGVVMSAGGIPIQAGGALLGGVGVSGAPSGETDEECARAGIEAVQDDLEMAG
ncbi:MAG: heme-binding protein [Gammaproteobacteria bacterium]|nr:MAG: heme-binding protein [Gammaproteobacteria bacterium]